MMTLLTRQMFIGYVLSIKLQTFLCENICEILIIFFKSSSCHHFNEHRPQHNKYAKNSSSISKPVHVSFISMCRPLETKCYKNWCLPGAVDVDVNIQTKLSMFGTIAKVELYKYGTYSFTALSVTFTFKRSVAIFKRFVLKKKSFDAQSTIRCFSFSHQWLDAERAANRRQCATDEWSLEIM